MVRHSVICHRADHPDAVRSSDAVPITCTLDLMTIKIIASCQEAEALERSVAASARRALHNVRRAANGSDAIQVLWQMKVAAVGCNPLDAESPLNLIEQINQTFTYLASARAVRILLAERPADAPYKLNLGTTPGSDIESTNGRVAAEVFAAVNTSNNRKLAKDIAKVRATAADAKYVFFMCPGISQGRQGELETTSEIKIWSVGPEP